MTKEYALFLSGIFDRTGYFDEKPEDMERKGVKWVEVSNERIKYVTDSSKEGWRIVRGKAVCHIVLKYIRSIDILMKMNKEEIKKLMDNMTQDDFVEFITIEEIKFNSEYMKKLKKLFGKLYTETRSKEILLV